MPTIDRDGVAIYYEVQGGAGDPVLLLMGLGTDAHGWEFQVPAFAARHRVILVDNRGVGRSGKPAPPYSIAEMAEDARAVLDAVGAPRAHVVGLSMGGMIAQELALAHPARVGALVLAATYARPGDGVRRAAEGAPVRSPFGALAGGFDLSTIDVRQVFGYLMPLVLSPAFLVDKREWLRDFFARSMGYGVSMDGIIGQVTAALAHDATARLPSLRAPTLVLTGAGDRLVPPRHSEELARLIPGAELVTIEEAPHGLHMELPERFNDTALGFLDEHPLARLPLPGVAAPASAT